jgi:hypothetical protein
VLFCVPVLTVAAIILGFLFLLWNFFALAVLLDICLVVTWLNLRKDREERMQRQQEAAQPQIHPTEETVLRARVAYLEEQLARRHGSPNFSLSAPSERPDGKEEPEVVAMVDISRRVQAEDARPSTGATNERLAEDSARQPLVQVRPTEKEELTIRRKAIEVLLAALDDAVAQGILTQESYETKRSKYRRELRRIEKSLKAPP